MSRQNDEKRYAGKGKSNGNSATAGQTPIFTFHPTKEQKEHIRSVKRPLSETLDTLSKYLEQGCKLTLGFSPQQMSYYVIIRSNTEKWDESLALSAWHSDLPTAIAALEYCLMTVATDYPESLPKAYQTSYDW